MISVKQEHTTELHDNQDNSVRCTALCSDKFKQSSQHMVSHTQYEFIQICYIYIVESIN